MSTEIDQAVGSDASGNRSTTPVGGSNQPTRAGIAGGAGGPLAAGWAIAQIVSVVIAVVTACGAAIPAVTKEVLASIDASNKLEVERANEVAKARDRYFEQLKSGTTDIGLLRYLMFTSVDPGLRAWARYEHARRYRLRGFQIEQHKSKRKVYEVAIDKLSEIASTRAGQADQLVQEFQKTVRGELLREASPSITGLTAEIDEKLRDVALLAQAKSLAVREGEPDPRQQFASSILTMSLPNFIKDCRAELSSEAASLEILSGASESDELKTIGLVSDPAPQAGVTDGWPRSSSALGIACIALLLALRANFKLRGSA